MTSVRTQTGHIPALARTSSKACACVSTERHNRRDLLAARRFFEYRESGDKNPACLQTGTVAFACRYDCSCNKWHSTHSTSAQLAFYVEKTVVGKVFLKRFHFCSRRSAVLHHWYSIRRPPLTVTLSRVVWQYCAYLFQHGEVRMLRNRGSSHLLATALGIAAIFLMLLFTREC